MTVDRQKSADGDWAESSCLFTQPTSSSFLFGIESIVGIAARTRQLQIILDLFSSSRSCHRDIQGKSKTHPKKGWRKSAATTVTNRRGETGYSGGMAISMTLILLSVPSAATSLPLTCFLRLSRNPLFVSIFCCSSFILTALKFCTLCFIILLVKINTDLVFLIFCLKVFGP